MPNGTWTTSCVFYFTAFIYYYFYSPVSQCPLKKSQGGGFSFIRSGDLIPANHNWHNLQYLKREHDSHWHVFIPVTVAYLINMYLVTS